MTDRPTMTTAGRALRVRRAGDTRELIITTAERLFAEHGLLTVSNRQISEAAGQGNNTAVGYHFGTKTDLIRAVVHKHSEQIELLRRERLDEFAGSIDLRDRVACLVRPLTDHLTTLGRPTWYARFSAQVMTDPRLRDILLVESLTLPAIRESIDELNRCLPVYPAEIGSERGMMARMLITHTCAEQERALADGEPRRSWEQTGSGLIDALVGLLLAPVTPA